LFLVLFFLYVLYVLRVLLGAQGKLRRLFKG
jgi:hypothetical protein